MPFTQIGYRYDFIHHHWLGPDIGEQYDPGTRMGKRKGEASWLRVSTRIR